MSSLFSKTGQMAKKNLPVALNSLFKISRRQVHFQDVVFGMENEQNLVRMMKYEKSGGPSMIMNAVAYDIQTSFITDQKSIQGNDDTARVFGLNRLKIVPSEYSAFPLGVLQNVRDRKGLFEVSFQYDEKRGPWNPEKLLEYLSQRDVSALKNIGSHSVFESFLKKRNATEEEIANMYAAVYRKNLPTLTDPNQIAHLKEPFEDHDPTKNLRPEKIKELCERVAEADENLPSFTDIEFGLFFLYLNPSERYNMACLLQGGHFIKTEEVAVRLQELLELKKAKNTKQYDRKLSDFMVATKGDTGITPRSEKIINSFRQLPLFDLIFQQNSDFMARNFEALCAKIDAYLLNLVKPGEKLVINLQFPFVFGGAPNVITLLVSAGENDIIDVEELLTDKSDPLSLTAQTVDSRLVNSIKYCGTPSANIWVLENPDAFSEKCMSEQKSLTQLNKLATNDEDVFKNKINALVALLADENIIYRFLDGRRFFTYRFNHWYEDCESLARRGIITTVSEVKFSRPDNDPIDVKNISWAPIQTFELSEKFKIEKAKTLNKLPSGFPEPIAYPEHIGAAAPLNPLNETGQLMTEETFKKLTQKD